MVQQPGNAPLQLLLYHVHCRTWAHLLRLLAEAFNASVAANCRDQPASGNLLSVHFDSGNLDVARSSWQQAVYIAVGSDPYELVDASVVAAAAIAGERHGKHEVWLPVVCLRQQQQQQHWLLSCVYSSRQWLLMHWWMHQWRQQQQ
jgi:hypothetical protein